MQIIHFSIELWGAVLSLVSMISVIITRHFDKKGAFKLIVLMMTSALLMISDSLAWIFRGNMSDAGYYVVRTANFCAFFFGFLIMPLAAEYITHIISKRSGIYGLYWKYIEWILFVTGTVCLIVNVFRPYLYTFDNQNVYYRLTFSFVPGMIVFVGLVITLGVVFGYVGYLNKVERFATISYLLLPSICVVIQVFHYGIALTNIATVVSSLILFLSYEYNYMQYNIEKERVFAEERIRQVNNQIQPHFVFNALSVIRHLCKKSPEEAVEAINEFSGYLRSSTDFLSEATVVPAERELDLVRHYVYLEQKRFGDSVSVEYDIQDTDFELPPFSVQTAVENAVRHGLRSKTIENGTLTVRTFYRDNRHIVVVEDNGIGFDTEKLSETESGHKHIGIANTKERLRAICKGEMKIESTPDKGTRVTIIIPDKKS